MTEYIVKGMISALKENYQRKKNTISENTLKQAINHVCENVSNINEFDSIVKECLISNINKTLNENKIINSEMYATILENVATELEEGFMDKAYDAMHAVKGRVIGTPEEAAQTVDKITTAIVNKLHEIYPTIQQYEGKRYNNFFGRLLDVCRMVRNESMIDGVVKQVIQDEIERMLEVNPLTNYRNPKRCFAFVKDCIGGAGGLMYSATDFLKAIKRGLGINESKNNTTVLNEKDLNKLLVEAVEKNIKRIKNEL